VPNTAFAGACVDTEIDWLALTAFANSTTCGAALKLAFPAWSYSTWHVPVPLVIVNVAPTFEHAPLLENVTVPPGALAPTEKLEPNTAFAGACVVTEIDWVAFCAETDSTTCGAALKLAFPPWSYSTWHVPLALVIVNVAPTLEHAPPLEKTTAPPGAVAATENIEPNAPLAGACVVTVIACDAFTAATDSATCGAAL
jgi:hypothetical protein